MRSGNERPSTLVLWVLVAALIVWMFAAFDDEPAQSVPYTYPTREATSTPHVERATTQVVIAVIATSTTKPQKPRKQPTPDMTCQSTETPGTICKWPIPTPTFAPAVTSTPYPICSNVLIDGSWCEWPDSSLASKD